MSQENQGNIFNKLEPEQQALVAIAVLLDGFDSPFFLGDDFSHQDQLRLAAEEIVKDAPQQRLPYVATLLRRALNELRNQDE